MTNPLSMLHVSTKNHVMTVLRDEGLYRHIRFQEPGTSIWHFDLITWPGHLVITGDLNTYHFSRLDDMFKFFRSRSGYINPSYWAEKLRGPIQFKSYSPEAFKQRVFEAFWEDRDARPGPQQPLWQAIRYEVLSEDVIWSEDTARAAATNFRYICLDRPAAPLARAEDFKPQLIPRRSRVSASPRFEFYDVWEWDLKEYDYHFLLALHAIVWGINKYDAEHSQERPPKRIQLRRSRGWKKPEGAIAVTRPTVWGNPWRLDFAAVVGPGMDHVAYLTPEAARSVAVGLYRAWLTDAWPTHLLDAMADPWVSRDASMQDRRQRILDRLPELRGRDLGCWCPHGQDFYGEPIACHADVLLELANAEVVA